VQALLTTVALDQVSFGVLARATSGVRLMTPVEARPPDRVQQQPGAEVERVTVRRRQSRRSTPVAASVAAARRRGTSKNAFPGMRARSRRDLGR
jgi:hypothetical protein